MKNIQRPLAAGILAALIGFTFATPADAAILNSLRGFDHEEKGWSGSVEGSYAASGGNTDESTFASAGRVQWRGGRNTYRLMGSAERTTSRGEETAKSVMGHLRHNYDLTDRWATVAFLQAQHNPFQRLDSRYLAGLGLRFDLIEEGPVLWSVGAVHMYESERIKDEDDRTEVHRLSAYSSAEAELREGVKLDALLFYQPRWSDFEDWRMLGQVELEVELTGVLALFTGYKIEHDATPPAGVEKTDWTTTTGLRASF